MDEYEEQGEKFSDISSEVVGRHNNSEKSEENQIRTTEPLKTI